MKNDQGTKNILIPIYASPIDKQGVSTNPKKIDLHKKKFDKYSKI